MSSIVWSDILPEIDKVKVEKWMLDAKTAFIDGDYRTALQTYREILKVDERNELAEYYIAECQYNLTVYKFAKKHITQYKSMVNKYGGSVKDEYYWLKARIYHCLEELDSAIIFYNKFLEINGDSKRKEYQPR